MQNTNTGTASSGWLFLFFLHVFIQKKKTVTPRWVYTRLTFQGHEHRTFSSGAHKTLRKTFSNCWVAHGPGEKTYSRNQLKIQTPHKSTPRVLFSQKQLFASLNFLEMCYPIRSPHKWLIEMWLIHLSVKYTPNFKDFTKKM